MGKNLVIMKSKSIGLSFSILGFVVAIIANYLDNPEESFLVLDILKYGGILMLMTGAIINYRSSSAFVKEFNDSSWEKDIKDMVLSIPYSKHKKKSPIVKVFQKDGNSYSEVGIEIKTNNNDVEVRTGGLRFIGKVVIK